MNSSLQIRAKITKPSINSRCLRAALATTPAGEAQFGIGAALPVQSSVNDSLQ